MKKIRLSEIQKMIGWAMDPSDDWRQFARFYPKSDPVEPYHRFLRYLADWMKPEIMLELGVKDGMGVAHLADGNPRGFVYGLDRVLKPDAIIVSAKRNNVDLMQGLSPGDIPALVGRFWPDYGIGLAHLDTIHTPEQVESEIEALYPYLEQGGVICVDDIWIDQQVEDYWLETLTNDKRFLTVGSANLHVTGFGILIRSEKYG